jgi:hypothetical protein
MASPRPLDRTARRGHDAVAAPGTSAGHHLVFLPEREQPRFFLWGAGSAASPLAARGLRGKALLVDEALALCEVEGTSISLLDALPLLGAPPRLPGPRRTRPIKPAALARSPRRLAPALPALPGKSG